MYEIGFLKMAQAAPMSTEPAATPPRAVAIQGLVEVCSGEIATAAFGSPKLRGRPRTQIQPMLRIVDDERIQKPDHIHANENRGLVG